MKRYLVYPFDFDSRAITLQTEIADEWDDAVKDLWRQNKEKVRSSLRIELGEKCFESKARNFADCGPAPFSMNSYHNALYHQIRYAFCCGYYYPALVAACALGERMLNHLILDLRSEYVATPNFKKVHRKTSFDNWQLLINCLDEWSVFQHEKVRELFTDLAAIRNHSIHFNPSTYNNLRDDALRAILTISEIIRLQFGFFANQKWALPGTAGQTFITRAAEREPFIKKYYLPLCPLVSPMFSIRFANEGVLFFDFDTVDDVEISDEEFAAKFNNRNPNEIAPSELPVPDGVVCYIRPFVSMSS